MVVLIWISILASFPTPSTYQTDKLVITIEKIEEQKGSLRVGIFASEKDYLKKPMVGKVVKVTGESVKVEFSGLKPGTYALSVVHDVNDNGKLDTNILGVPTEGLGFSNNISWTFKPPSFEKSSFQLPAITSLTVAMKY